MQKIAKGEKRQNFATWHYHEAIFDGWCDLRVGGRKWEIMYCMIPQRAVSAVAPIFWYCCLPRCPVPLLSSNSWQGSVNSCIHSLERKILGITPSLSCGDVEDSNDRKQHATYLQELVSPLTVRGCPWPEFNFASNFSICVRIENEMTGRDGPERP